MRRIVVVENVTLDGVMQGPGRTDEDTRGGFTAGGWGTTMLSADPEASMASMSTVSDSGGATAMLFGRVTYLDLVGHWLTTTVPNPFTDILRDTTKYVASTTLTEPLPWPNSVLLQGNAVEAIDVVKRDGDGALVVLGSGDLVRQLLTAGLVDELVLTTVPLVLGQGTRLFGPDAVPLEPISVRAFASGTTVGHYRVTG